MEMMAVLRGRNSGEAYQLLQLLEQRSAESGELYASLEDFLGLLGDKSSLVRVRGFRLACAQARWDTEGRLDAAADALLAMLEDDRPTAVRQCMAALPGLLHWRPGLAGAVREKLAALDLSRYRDSMRPLIERDVAELQKLL